MAQHLACVIVIVDSTHHLQRSGQVGRRAVPQPWWEGVYGQLPGWLLWTDGKAAPDAGCYTGRTACEAAFTMSP